MNTRLSRLTIRIKRFTALVLALALCFAFVSCKDEPDIVEGGNSLGGYSFSYPENWKLITEGTNTQITIADVGGALPYAMVRFTVFENAEGTTAAEYWTNGVGGFSLVYDSYKVRENKRGAFEKEGVNSAYNAVVDVSLKGETKLDGQPEGPGESAAYVVHQLVFEGDGRICLASFMSAEINYDVYSTVMENIKESFAFTEAEKAESVVDKGVAEFSIPTPAGWTLETAEAYYRLSYGKATVIASVFAMGENLGAKEYWEKSYKASVSASIVDFAEEKVKDSTLDGVTAVDVSYKGKSVSGNSYNFRQLICVYYGQVFIITLTASDADYGEAVKGFEAVVAGFKFK